MKNVTSQMSSRTSRMNLGFTLIELLVVVAIIGILAGLVTANLSSARGKARDAARQSDLQSIQTAVELAIASQGTPPGLSPTGQGAGTSFLSNAANTNLDQWIPGLAPTYVSHVPVDPKNNQIFYYRYVLGSGNQLGAYFLEGHLEVKPDRPTLTTIPSDDPASLGSFVTGSYLKTDGGFFRLSSGPVAP